MTLRHKLRTIEAEAAVETLQPEIVFKGSIKSWSQPPATKQITYRISAMIDGKEIGRLDFVQMENVRGSVIDDAYKDKKIEKAIYFEEIKVSTKYRKQGIAEQLLQKFGEIYQQQYANWPVIVFYLNPAAEYAYRKAVSLGYIPDYTLDEAWIQREPDVYQGTENEQIVKDLRGKLPAEVQGPEVWAARHDFRAITAGVENLPNFAVNDLGILSTFSPDEDIKQESREIQATVDGKVVGMLNFDVITDLTTSEVRLSILNIKVDKQYREKGIATEIYKKFGEIYNSQYLGAPVSRMFENPVAEYAFRSAVADGYIDPSALSENYIDRNYYGIDKNLIEDLRERLPKHVRGPDKWALREDYRKIMANNKIQYSDLTFTESMVDEMGDPKEYYQSKNRVDVSYNGQSIGYFTYEEVVSRFNGIKDVIFSYIEVNSDQRGNGFANLMFRKFGEIYKSKYNGWPIHAIFEHPGAEAAFNNAVADGWIPASVIDKSFLANAYDEVAVTRQ